MSRPFRLAFLTSHPIQYQAPLFRALARRPEIDLTVLFCSEDGVREYEDSGFGRPIRWDTPLLEGYRHVFLKNLNASKRGGTLFRLLNPGVGRVLREHRFDALIVHGWAHFTNWLAFITASRLGVPILLRGESNGLREPGGIKGAVKRCVLGWLFRRTAGFLAIGSLNREFYRRYDVADERIFFAPYAVDNVFFRAQHRGLPSRDRLRSDEGIPVHACVFMFCGKLTAVKRPLDLLEAFARLPHDSSCFLLFVGDGPLRPQIEARAHEVGNVRVTGFRNQSELPRYYAMADVLALPSAFEPWGLVVNEALNYGLDIIASDQVGAAVDLVRRGVTGTVVPVGDVPGLARAMTQYASQSRTRPSPDALNLIADWDVSAAADGIVTAVRAVGARE